MLNGEDLGIFFDEDEFADSVIVDGGAPISANFEIKWVDVVVGNVPYSGDYATLFGQSTHFEGKQGKIATVNSVNYRIFDIQPDGTGTSLVVLVDE